MILSNTHFMTIITFILLIIIWWVFLRLMYNKSNNKNLILLFLTFFFIIINIFEIKWWYNTDLENVEWWKVVFAVDVSKSMLAKDITYWDNILSRLEWAKWLIWEYITTNQFNLYGLIVFAWESLEVLPFTNDLSIFKTILFWINNDNISKYWSDLNNVFNSLSIYFEWETDWWLAVIFTDWWDEDIVIWKEVLSELEEKNIKILLVWVWTERWAKIPVSKDFFWRPIFKKYNWEEVITKLNSKQLKSFSNKYNFDYFTLDNTDNFNNIDKYITNNINLISLEKNINNRIDYTRFFIFLSLLFFTLFLINDSFIWKKK